jgi:4-amino-4-deoxy-L-arabinose transferase-like glycosyltransferase
MVGHRENGGFWSVLRFCLLAQAVFTLLTNAYYLQVLEPWVSRNVLGVLSVALAVLTLLWDGYGRPSIPSIVTRILRGHTTLVALGAILVVAFGLRLWGVSYGLPQSYVSDEYDFVHSYLKMIKRGDFNPHWWIHPSLQAYVNVLTYLIVFLSQVSSGRWHSVHELTEEDMLFWGRFGTGVIPGTLAVLVTFCLGRKMFGTRAGLLSAALMAVFPAAVEVSQYNKPDPLLTLLAPLSVLVVLIYFERGGWKLAHASGLAIGLTAAAKYNGAFVFLTFALAALMRLKSRTLRSPEMYLGVLGAFAGFMIGCPYFLSEIPSSIDHVADALYNYGYGGWPDAEGVDNWSGHAKYAMSYGAGLPAFLAALAGLGVALYRLDARMAIFLSFPVLYFSYYSSQRMNFPGNLVCVYVFLAILAALAIESAAENMVRVKLRPVRRFSVAAIAILLLFFPLAVTIEHNRERTRLDTGTYANTWIEGHIPPGTHFAVERQTPVLDAKRYKITLQSRITDRAVNDYLAEGVEYLIVSSALYGRFGPEHRQTKNYQRLFRICPTVAEFPPVPGKLVGPTIRILRVGDTDDASQDTSQS